MLLRLSISNAPFRASSFSVKEIVPPLDPAVPQRLVAAALTRIPEAAFTVVPVRVTAAFVFVIKNRGHAVAVSDPPVIVNVPVPTEASPDML